MKVIELHRSVTESNDRDAEVLREELRQKGIFFVNLMSAAGSGKTTLLSRTIRDLKEEYRIAVLEADIIVFASPVYWWDITGTLKTAIDRLYAMGSYFMTKPHKETVLLMTSGGSPIDHMLDWYKEFEKWFGWKSLGAVMNDIEQAKEIGANIK